MATKRELRNRWTRDPGLSIRTRIIDFVRQLKFDHGNAMGHSRQVLAMLDGLPFREEVPNGGDFRGADFGGGVQLDFRGCDFSYGSSASFIRCNLVDARLDELTGRSCSFSDTLDRASFRGAKLPRSYMMNSKVRFCNFEKANLNGTCFNDSDLSGSSFQNANCVRVSFHGANLIGCDFRNAVLEGAVFGSAQIDETTDFRGASLVNAHHKERHDNFGNLVCRGVDLRIAKHDATTRFGEDNSALELEVIDAACGVAANLPDPRAKRVHQELTAIRKLVGSKRAMDWQREIGGKLTEAEKEVFQEIIEEAYANLL